MIWTASIRLNISAPLSPAATAAFLAAFGDGVRGVPGVLAAGAGAGPMEIAVQLDAPTEEDADRLAADQVLIAGLRTGFGRPGAPDGQTGWTARITITPTPRNQS